MATDRFKQCTGTTIVEPFATEIVSVLVLLLIVMGWERGITSSSIAYLNM
jgi:hypothetical protein